MKEYSNIHILLYSTRFLFVDKSLMVYNGICKARAISKKKNNNMLHLVNVGSGLYEWMMQCLENPLSQNRNFRVTILGSGRNRSGLTSTIFHILLGIDLEHSVQHCKKWMEYFWNRKHGAIFRRQVTLFYTNCINSSCSYSSKIKIMISNNTLHSLQLMGLLYHSYENDYIRVEMKSIRRSMLIVKRWMPGWWKIVIYSWVHCIQVFLNCAQWIH